jgi:mannose-6-phosphate isomerase-like protein (cupin superfamily)
LLIDVRYPARFFTRSRILEEAMTNAATPQETEPVFSIEPGRTATLKVQSHQTGESVMVFEEVTPPGTAAPLHVHHDSDEVMYVVAGEFTFKVGDKVTRGGPGACAFMPRGIPHAWKNIGTESGRALFIYSPAQAGKLFEALAMSGGKLPSVDSADLTEFLKRHDLEIVGPEPF